jgi:hypothetical protein
MKQILITFKVFVFFYLCVAFATLEIDFSKWTQESRVFIIITIVLSVFIQLMIYAHDQDIKLTNEINNEYE